MHCCNQHTVQCQVLGNGKALPEAAGNVAVTVAAHRKLVAHHQLCCCQGLERQQQAQEVASL